MLDQLICSSNSVSPRTWCPMNLFPNWIPMFSVFWEDLIPAQTTKFSLTSFSLTRFICLSVQHKLTRFSLTSFICLSVQHKLTRFSLTSFICLCVQHKLTSFSLTSFICLCVQHKLTRFSLTRSLLVQKLAMPADQLNAKIGKLLSWKLQIAIRTSWAIWNPKCWQCCCPRYVTANMYCE